MYTRGLGGTLPMYTGGYEGCAQCTPVGMRDVPSVHPWVWEVLTLVHPWVWEVLTLLHPWARRDVPSTHPWARRDVSSIHPGVYGRVYTPRYMAGYTLPGTPSCIPASLLSMYPSRPWCGAQ